jgi:copper chaperone
MTKLKIEGMTCGHCVASVKKALEDIQGVSEVVVDLDSGQATVDGSPNQSVLIEAVTKEGYHAEVMQ